MGKFCDELNARNNELGFMLSEFDLNDSRV